MKFRRAFSLLALTTLSVAAHCQTFGQTPNSQNLKTIQIGATAIDVPIPDGYCLPTTAEDKAVEQLMIAVDTQNFTHAIMTECGKSSSYKDKAEYFMLKTPSNALLMVSKRADVLKELSALIGTDFMDGKAILNDAAKSFDEIVPVGFALDGDIGLKAVDDTCAYFTGVTNVSATKLGDNYKVAAAGCITTVDGKLISINWYGYDVSVDGIKKLQAKVKSFVVTMSGNRPQ